MRSILVASISFLLACSSSAGNDSTHGDAASDAASLDVATEANDDVAIDAPVYNPCGAPPYVNYTMKVGEILTSGDTQPLAGATLTFDLCPELSVTTDGAGVAIANVQRGVAFTATVTAPNHITVIAGEELVPIADPLEQDRFVELLPMDNAFVIPGYSASAPSFAAVIQPDGIAGSPCNTFINVHFVTPSGVTAHYMTATWPLDTTETVADASVGPIVFFTGVTGSETTMPPSTTGGAEASCVASDRAVPLHQTGKFKLAPGAWTVGDVTRFVPKL